MLIYCDLEMVAGSGGMRLLGLTELQIKSGRLEGGRLSGPFVAVAMIEEYMGIQSLICIYVLMRFSGYRCRMFWLGLLAGNLAFLTATGNRGGIVSLVVGLVVFLFLFEKEPGRLKSMTWVAIGSFVFAIWAFVVVQYTQCNVLFERLEGTEFHGALADTREGWVTLWEQIVSRLVFGHGPRLRMEMFQFSLYAYQQYLFMLVGVALSVMALEGNSKQERQHSKQSKQRPDKDGLLSRAREPEGIRFRGA